MLRGVLAEEKGLILHPFQQTMQITYYGHSCFQVVVGGKRILFDPFISGNPLAQHISIEEVEADYILISHAHDDHTRDALAIARRTGAQIVGIWEIYSWALRNGIDHAHPMNIGGSWTFDFGTVKMTAAVHSSSFADGSYGGSPAGFYIETPEGNLYYAGDTALFNGMKMLGKYHNVDLAFLPIGNNFTMGVDDALIASRFIKCDQIIGMHFDTFGFITIDHAQAIEKFKERDRSLRLMEIGQTIQWTKS